MIPFEVQVIGFVAQILFSVRTLVQWLLSEKAQKVLSPLLFWQLSLAASLLLFLYSLLIRDVNILLGQLLGFFIYIRNLQLKHYWSSIKKPIRWLILGAPLLLFIAVISLQEKQAWNFENFQFDRFWLSIGFIGQVIFSLRFLYQWYYSERLKESVLPFGFWMISLIGSGIILVYALKYELYPILVGHVFGIIVYSRNLMLIRKFNAQ